MKRRSFLGALLAAAAAPIAIAKAVASKPPVPLFVQTPYIPLYTTPALMSGHPLIGYKGEDFVEGWRHLSERMQFAQDEIYRNTRRDGVRHEA